MKLNEKFFSVENNQTQRIQTLIIGRLLVIFLLLVASWVWNSGRLKLSFENFPRWVFLVFLISVGLTIVYFFLLRLSKNFAWQVRTQFLLDALLVTWLVWRTGDLTSPYITLYIVIIAVSSIFLRASETLLIAAICVVLFTLLSVLTALAVVDSFGATTDISRAVQIIAFHIVAFLVVGLLASRLSERRASGEKLIETAKTLANLRVLHERIVESIRSGGRDARVRRVYFDFRRRIACFQRNRTPHGLRDILETNRAWRIHRRQISRLVPDAAG